MRKVSVDSNIVSPIAGIIANSVTYAKTDDDFNDIKTTEFVSDIVRLTSNLVSDSTSTAYRTYKERVYRKFQKKIEEDRLNQKEYLSNSTLELGKINEDLLLTSFSLDYAAFELVMEGIIQSWENELDEIKKQKSKYEETIKGWEENSENTQIPPK